MQSTVTRVGYWILRIVVSLSAYFFNLTASASTPDLTLSEMVKKSTAVIRGIVHTCLAENKKIACEIGILNSYKGVTDDSSIKICSDPDFSESPKLELSKGRELIFFLVSYNGCFQVTNGFRGVLAIEQSVVYPGVIEGMPDMLPIKQFEAALASEIK